MHIFLSLTKLFKCPVSKSEVCCLIREFNALMGESSVAKKAASGLDRGKFRSILHNNFGMTDDMIMDGGMHATVFLVFLLTWSDVTRL